MSFPDDVGWINESRISFYWVFSRKKAANFTAMLNDSMPRLDMQLETLEEINQSSGVWSQQRCRTCSRTEDLCWGCEASESRVFNPCSASGAVFNVGPRDASQHLCRSKHHNFSDNCLKLHFPKGLTASAERCRNCSGEQSALPLEACWDRMLEEHA